MAIVSGARRSARLRSTAVAGLALLAMAAGGCGASSTTDPRERLTTTTSLVVAKTPCGPGFQSQMDLDECAGRHSQEAQRALADYRAAHFSGPTFAAAERAWLAFVKETCTAQMNRFRGGSIEPMVYSSCVAALDNQRLRELKATVASRH